MPVAVVPYFIFTSKWVNEICRAETCNSLEKYISRYILLLKPIEFCGHTLRSIKSFPVLVRHEVGHELDKVQRGLTPSDWKPMPTVGKGTREIRIQERGQYRVIYLATHGKAIYVLHAFRKKTRKTRQSDIKLARAAFSQLMHRNMS